MKLFQQLLVAPAALGLLAPVAVSAAELNLDGVNKYATEESVTSVSQLSDVKPTDWAYQALSNLIENYGCVAGYPNGTYRGGKAMTRFEAAALLNACLDRVSEVTDELKKLMAEFEKELAVLKGRVDGLEAKVGVLEAQQFSTTTKLKGIATMVLGGTTYGGNAINVGNNTAALLTNPAAALPNAMSFNYDVRLNFDTSFTGKDLLRTTLRSGSANGSAFYAGPYGGAITSGTALESFFQEDGNAIGGNNSVGINRLFYQFPIGSEFTATFGGRVRQDDMLAMWPSVYPSDTVLDVFTYAGSPVVYNLALGSGAGLWWQRNGFSISANYVAVNGNQANPVPGSTTPAGIPNSGGIGNNATNSSFTTQIGYAGNNWGLAAAYNYSQNAGFSQATNFANALLTAFGASNSTNGFALSGYWQPSQSGWIPSISAGWGIATTNLLNGFGGGDLGLGGQFGFTTNSWTVGLQWNDAFVKGNAAGMAFGQTAMVSKMTGALQSTINGFVGANYGAPVDGNWAWEWWYKFQVTDNISVTPAIFYLSQPTGMVTVNQGNGGYGNLGAFGYLVKTTFKF